jgi:anthranilate phosphoribosyltransferase
MERKLFKLKMAQLFKGELSPEEGKEFLSQLHQKGEKGEEIGISAQIMRKYSVKLPVPEELRKKLIDIVGTGGDKSGTFNISTTTALLISAVGSKVAKHGNRSITSKSGSADMLEALGFNLNLTPEKQVKMLEEVGFTFIFAINHHPAMKHIMPIRKALPHPTIFNLLGPLTNPAGAEKYLLGVYTPKLLDKIATALTHLPLQRGLVVSSDDGLDELSIEAPTYCRLVEGGKIEKMTIEPEKFGLKGRKENLKGGDGKVNAQITRNLLEGREKGDKLKALLLNAGVALWIDGKVDSIAGGIELARETIESGKAGEHLAKVIQLSQKLGEGESL